MSNKTKAGNYARKEPARSVAFSTNQRVAPPNWPDKFPTHPHFYIKSRGKAKLKIIVKYSENCALAIQSCSRNFCVVNYISPKLLIPS